MQELLSAGIVQENREFGHFICGVTYSAPSSTTLPVINPGDGRAVCRIASGDAADIQRAVTAAQAALAGAWGRQTATERGRLLLKLSAEILTHRDNIARIEAIDTGKPLQ